MEAQKQAIDEMIIEGQKETRSNGQKWHRNITNFRNGNQQERTILAMEAQNHKQMQNWS